MYLYTAAQSRELDRLAMQDHGIAGYELMCRAGGAAFDALTERWPEAGQVLVVCGAGNNAGDGFVLARLAHRVGLQVHVVLLAEASRLRGDARRAFDDMLVAGVRPAPFSGSLPAGAHVVVDAVFGTGLDRAPAGPWRVAIESINGYPAPVLAMDLPSGLHADTGRVLEVAVRAQCTVSFIAHKRGLFTASGPDQAGELVFDDLGVPGELYRRLPGDCRLYVYPPPVVLPPRWQDSHKGDYGHVLVVGGNYGMAGAARLAAEAAARCGAGLVSVVTRAGQAAVINAGRPELMVHEIEHGDRLVEALERASVVAVGPGLGQDEWARQAWSKLRRWPGPKVVDADALGILARNAMRADNWILTPHPGEAARLLGSSTAQVQHDRFAAARAIQHRFGGVCVLKGAGTLVAGADALALCRTGNPGMASAGMGDVLTGVVAALLAQAPAAAPMDLASAAVLLHGRAAELAAADGQRGLLPADLLPHLRCLVEHV